MCLFQKAKEYYLAAIEKEPTNTTFINAFGKMWNKLGNFRKAIEFVFSFPLFFRSFSHIFGKKKKKKKDV